MENFYYSQPHLFPRSALRELSPSCVDREDSIEALEAEAKGLRLALASADCERTRHLIQHLKMLSGRLPMNSRRARRSAGIIQTIVTQAEIRLEDLRDDEDRRHLNASKKMVFELAVYSVMSGKAKAYFDSFCVDTTYAIKPITMNGNIVVAGKAEVVDGEELRQHFSMIKYHSMSEVEKKELLSKTFGIDRDGDMLSTELAILKREREEVLSLHHALRDMEAYHAAQHLVGAQGQLSRVFLRLVMDHKRFAQAHAEVDTLVVAYDALIEEPGDEEAMRSLKFAREHMKQTLKQDIMDGVLLSGDSENNQDIVVNQPLVPMLVGVPVPEVFL